MGDLYGFIIADVPGIIEGASAGKGLGHKFLRHITKTKVLLHLVSFEHGSASAMMKAYETIRDELGKFNPELLEKEEIILLTKTDVVDEATIDAAKKKFEKLGKKIYTVTLFDEAGVKNFKDALIALLR